MLYCKCAVIRDNIDLKGGGGDKKTSKGLWCDGYVTEDFCCYASSLTPSESGTVTGAATEQQQI